MMFNVGRVINQINMHRDMHGTPITLSWVEIAGGTADPTTGETTGGTKTNRTATIKGNVHFISPAQTGQRQFSMLKAGDAILDLDPAAAIDSKPHLTFTFAGSAWTQKTLPDEVTRALDAVYGGDTISRVVVVSLKT